MSSAYQQNNTSSFQTYNDASNYDGGKNMYYQNDHSQNSYSQNQNYSQDQSQLQSNYNHPMSDMSPQKRNSSRPPLSGNKQSDSRSRISIKPQSTLSNIKQRDEDSEDNTHQNSNILNSQQHSLMGHHNHSHSHNHLNHSKTSSKQQQNFQERMMRDRIKAAEKSFVVGRIKTGDTRLKRNQTLVQQDENGESSQGGESNRNKSQSILRSTKGSNMAGQTDNKDQKNGQGLVPSKSLNRTKTINTNNSIERQPSSVNQTQKPSSSPLKKKNTTTFNNEQVSGNQDNNFERQGTNQIRDNNNNKGNNNSINNNTSGNNNNSNEINRNTVNNNYDNNGNIIYNDNNKTNNGNNNSINNNVSANNNNSNDINRNMVNPNYDNNGNLIHNDNNKTNNGNYNFSNNGNNDEQQYFEAPNGENQYQEQGKADRGQLHLKTNNSHPSQQSSGLSNQQQSQPQNKRVQLPTEEDETNKISQFDPELQKQRSSYNNRNDSQSKSPINNNQRRQIRSFSSKGFISSRSSERLNKSSSKYNLPKINQKVQTQPDQNDSDSDSYNGKSKIYEGTRQKRSSQSHVNMHEKRLIDQGLNLKNLNNMDLIIQKITKTHNQRGNPYADPLTQQIFTKQFTEVFVQKLEKKRKNQKKTDFDYVDAAKVYYSVCDGSRLSKKDIGRGQKYLLQTAQQQSTKQDPSKRDKSQTDIKRNNTQQLPSQPSQTSINNNQIGTQSNFNPMATFQPAPTNLTQSESSPTIINSQRFNYNDGDVTQQTIKSQRNALSPQKKFQPLFIGARNNNQAPIYFNFIGGGGGSINGSDFLSSIYPVTTSSTHSFYPHSHFHKVNPFSGISSFPSQPSQDRSPFNVTQNIDTNYGQQNNYSQQDPMSPDRRPTNLDYQPSSIINNTNHFYNASIDYPQSNIYNNNNNTTNNNNNNNSMNNSNILDKSRNPTQFTSTGKLILPKLQLNQSNLDPDLQKAVQCSKILQYLNDTEDPANNKKKKAPIDPAEREKARQRLLGTDKANQPKSIRQQKEEERKKQDDEKFNGPSVNTSKRGKGENGSIESSMQHNPVTADNSIISEQMPQKQIQMKKPQEEYQNFIINYTQNYNDTVSIVLKQGYPEENLQSLLKVDQLSKDNFKNFQWKFDEVWLTSSSDQNKKNFRILKGRDEKIKQKCSFHFYNCNDLSSHKDYLKDVSIAYMINLQYEKDRVRNPTLLMYSIPNIFQQNKKEVEFVTQQEYYSTLECILEYRYQIRQEWEEDEMISIFYSLLDCMNELFSLNICHGNVTPSHIAYSYKTNRYKIFNFSAAQVSHRDYKGGYPIYYQWPFIAPEVKKGLSLNNSKSNKYDILASDMYSLGMTFLMIKYLIPENMRSQDAINRLISTVETDNRLSAQIIKSLLNKQQTKRLDNTYATLCNQIHSSFKQRKIDFTPYQKQDLVNLNPLPKQRWKCSKDSETIADFYYRIFQWQNAADRLKKLLDELLQIEKEQGEDATKQTQADKDKKQRILRDVWKSYFKQQEYDNALKYNQLYMELLSQAPEEKMKDKEFLENLSEDLKMTGQLYFTVQQLEKAIHYFDKTIQVLSDLYGNHHQDVVSMLNNIGVLYKQLQNLPKSLEYFQQAQIIMEETRATDDDLYFFIKYNIAIIYFEQDELGLSENILYEIYKVKTTEHRVKSVEVSQYAYVLGNIYIKKSHLPKAQQIIELAVKMRESCIGYDGELIKWKQLLANICFQLGQRKEAMDILIKTVQDVKKLRKQPQKKNAETEDATYNAIEDIGNMILETGNKKEALQFYHEALQLAKNQQEKQTGIISALEKKIKEVKK